MTRTSSTGRLTVPFAEWPAIDRRLWEEGLLPVDPFASMALSPGAGYGAGLAEGTVSKTRRGYSRWLGFLRGIGKLDGDRHPFDRVSLPLLGAYFNAMLAAGNGSYTVLGRFVDLQRALRITTPDLDAGFVTKPNGTSIRSLLPMERREFPVPDASVLVAWGQDMIAKALTMNEPKHRALALRDGLLISILASRARRLRAMTGLRAGRELRQEDDHYVVDLPRHLVKMKRTDRFGLPDDLTDPLDIYLAEGRPALLSGNRHDALWVASHGGPLTARGLTGVVERRSLERFGITFRTHRFRYAIGTTLPMHLPEHPGLAAAVIDNSLSTMSEHYDRAEQAAAMMRFQHMRDPEQAAAVEEYERRRRLRQAGTGRACAPDPSPTQTPQSRSERPALCADASQRQCDVSQGSPMTAARCVR